MKPHFRILIIFIVLGSIKADPARAQNISTTPIKWTLNGGKDLKTNAEFTYSGYFTTGSGNTIIWAQKDETSEFSVNSTEGAWSDLTQTGKTIYSIEQGGSKGTLTFEKSGSATTIVLDFPANDPNGSKIKFTVTSLTQLN